MKKQSASRPISPKTKAKRLKIKFFVSLIAAWNIWFACKIWMDGEEVYRVISARLSVAVSSSQNLVISAMSLLRQFSLTILAWMDVILPFVQDVIALIQDYIYPILLRRIISPVSHILAPVPGFILRHSITVYRWTSENVPLEYKLLVVVLGFLALNRRIDRFIKVFIFSFLGMVFAHSRLAGLYGNIHVQLTLFAVVPSVLAVDAIIRESVLPARAGNLLMYSITAPLLWFGMSFIPLSPPVTLIAHCSTYGFMIPFFYMIDEPNLLLLFSRFDKIFVPVRRLSLELVVPVATHTWTALNARFPRIGSAWEKISSITNENAQSRILSLVWSNKSMFGMLFGMIKSAPLIVIGIVTLLGLLAGIYYTYSSLSKVAYYAVFPWWISESVRVIIYNRREDFKSQLAFSLLFLSVETLVLSSSAGVISFILNLFHIPLIFLIRLIPVQVVKLVSKMSMFFPGIVSGFLTMKRAPAPDTVAPASQPSQDDGANKATLEDKKVN